MKNNLCWPGIQPKKNELFLHFSFLLAVRAIAKYEKRRYRSYFLSIGHGVTQKDV